MRWSKLTECESAYGMLVLTNEKRMGMKLFKDQRGIGHIIEIVVIAVIIIGVGVFIWWRMYGSQQQNNNATNNSAQTALEQAIANANCPYDDKDLCKFMTGWKLESDLKVESTQTIEGETTKSTFSSTNKGANSHLVMAIQGKPFETIIIGTTRYTKTGDGTWWKEVIEQADVSASTSTYDPSFEEPTTGSEPDKTSYKKIGTEGCGTLTCFKYQIIDPESPGTTQFLWFDNKDYQLRRMYVESVDGKFDQTYTYQNVTVTAPSPSKDLPAGQYIIPGADAPVSVPTTDDLMPTD